MAASWNGTAMLAPIKKKILMLQLPLTHLVVGTVEPSGNLIYLL